CTTTNAMRYKIINLECKTNAKFVINTDCRLKAVNRETSLVNMSCDVVGVVGNISVHIQVWQKNSKNIYRPFLINITENACDILDKRKSHIYTTIALNILKEFSNINHTSPYRGHVFIKNAYMDQRLIPVSPPTGLYKIVIRCFNTYSLEEYGTVNFFIEVKD
ncbi:uncharacterized protein LOC119665212, partial [Teleopsis dalmanni]|uniref:uncharacterized protein LOC119665212 n=1 Tax=Teleopsis dalmanni TaxID=139649 RepID=UPI0018CE6218